MMETIIEMTRQVMRLVPPRARMKLENLSPRPVMASMPMTMPEVQQAAMIWAEPFAAELQAPARCRQENRSSLSSRAQMMTAAMA